MQRADQLWAVERMQLSLASRSLQPSGKRMVVTGRSGSIFAGCQRSRVPRAEWQVPGRESVADRPDRPFTMFVYLPHSGRSIHKLGLLTTDAGGL
jgi:hypothetical protein